jgi:hypothetical protein
MGWRCDACKFWQEINPIIGECRRNAPVPSPKPMGAWWPQTEGDDWCGDYWPKPTSVPLSEALDPTATNALKKHAN